jgi:hypothetical protein
MVHLLPRALFDLQDAHKGGVGQRRKYPKQNIRQL